MIQRTQLLETRNWRDGMLRGKFSPVKGNKTRQLSATRPKV